MQNKIYKKTKTILQTASNKCWPCLSLVVFLVCCMQVIADPECHGKIQASSNCSKPTANGVACTACTVNPPPSGHSWCETYSYPASDCGTTCIDITASTGVKCNGFDKHNISVTISRGTPQCCPIVQCVGPFVPDPTTSLVEVDDAKTTAAGCSPSEYE